MSLLLNENVLGATARWTAAVRARETAREDALLRDPWAALLAGESGMAWVSARPPDSTLPIVLRTRYFDDYLQQVTDAGMQQVVLLAAGLDTRAYRLPWPAGTTIYEVDQLAVVAHKEQALAGARPNCERRAIAADLTEPWQQKLCAAGFAAAEPACFLLEGFLFYLRQDAMEQILDEVATFAASGSRIGFDVVNTATFTNPYTKPWLDMQAAAGAPWLAALDDPAEFLDVRGWDASLTQAGQPDANHGRWKLPVIPVTLSDAPHNWFVTGVKRAPAKWLRQVFTHEM
jgi:methyltransferase (TIGR00027 family)